MCLVTNHQCICFMTKIEKMTLFGEARKIKLLLPKRYVNIWGTMSASGLPAIHILLQGQTVDAEYYVEDILEKGIKPLLKRSKRTNEATTNKMAIHISTRWRPCPHLQARTGLVSSKPAKLYK